MGSGCDNGSPQPNTDLHSRQLNKPVYHRIEPDGSFQARSRQAGEMARGNAKKRDRHIKRHLDPMVVGIEFAEAATGRPKLVRAAGRGCGRRIDCDAYVKRVSSPTTHAT